MGLILGEDHGKENSSGIRMDGRKNSTGNSIIPNQKGVKNDGIVVHIWRQVLHRVET